MEIVMQLHSHHGTLCGKLTPQVTSQLPYASANQLDDRLYSLLFRRFYNQFYDSLTAALSSPRHTPDPVPPRSTPWTP